MDIKIFEDPAIIYNDLLYKDEVYSIIACCDEVHKQLGNGFSEIIYKDALSVELELNGIPFVREKEFNVHYKTFSLDRKYYCDFLIDDKIILEIKAQGALSEANGGQLLNYLAVAKKRLGLLVNFGENSLKFKRIIL